MPVAKARSGQLDAERKLRMATGPKDKVKALVFDVFGTVVDWRGTTIRELGAFGKGRGFEADWAAFADDWRRLYQPSMEEVRSGRRAWTILDELHRESLLRLVDKYGLKGLADHEIEHLNTIWHRLDPWPDVVEGLTRLKSRYIIGTLSNGNTGLLTRMAKRAGLPWDVILGAETARAYKPLPEAYQRNAALLNLEPHEVMLVAAHNDDLAAAAATGYRTAFVARPTEYGPNQTKDMAADRSWDVVSNTFTGVADAMGCPVR
jgi:2-haloacid dehalogenase